MSDRIRDLLRSNPELAGCSKQVQDMWAENDRYVRAGAGKPTKVGLCFGIDNGILCPKNAKTADSLWCRDHLYLAGSLPQLPGGPRGIPSEKRKFSNRQIRVIRKLRRDSPEKWTIQHLADTYDASPSTINGIVSGQYYRRSERDLEIEEHGE